MRLSWYIAAFIFQNCCFTQKGKKNKQNNFTLLFCTDEGLSFWCPWFSFAGKRSCVEQTNRKVQSSWKYKCGQGRNNKEESSFWNLLPEWDRPTKITRLHALKLLFFPFAHMKTNFEEDQGRSTIHFKLSIEISQVCKLMVIQIPALQDAKPFTEESSCLAFSHNWPETLGPHPHWTRRHKCKQIEPAVANRTVHTGRQHHQRNCPLVCVLASSVDWAQRICMQICLRVLCELRQTSAFLTQLLSSLYTVHGKSVTRNDSTVYWMTTPWISCWGSTPSAAGSAGISSATRALAPSVGSPPLSVTAKPINSSVRKLWAFSVLLGAV